MIYATNYTWPGAEIQGESQPTGFDTLSAAVIFMGRFLGAPLRQSSRLIIYDNGDGTRTALSDYPFHIDRGDSAGYSGFEWHEGA